jgi:hypothetical protein
MQRLFSAWAACRHRGSRKLCDQRVSGLLILLMRFPESGCRETAACRFCLARGPGKATFFGADPRVELPYFASEWALSRRRHMKRSLARIGTPTLFGMQGSTGT